MPYAFHITAPGMTADQYDEILKGLLGAGLNQPEGLVFHCCYEDENGFNVFDVWETTEQLGEFAKTLVPLVEQAGLQVIPPVPHSVHCMNYSETQGYRHYAAAAV